MREIQYSKAQEIKNRIQNLKHFAHRVTNNKVCYWTTLYDRESNGISDQDLTDQINQLVVNYSAKKLAELERQFAEL